MAKIGLYFDTDTGNTRKVAKMIRKLFAEDEVELMNISKVQPADFEKFSAYIVGTPTLGEGELPETLAEFLPSLDGMDLSGKTFALFGLGDQEAYSHEFVDGLGLLYEKLDSLGGQFIGQWPAEGYDFKFSRAVVDEDEFVGLVIDQDNQSDLTTERVESWVAAIKQPLLKAAQTMEDAA